jgi:hypothetical protein
MCAAARISLAAARCRLPHSRSAVARKWGSAERPRGRAAELSLGSPTLQLRLFMCSCTHSPPRPLKRPLFGKDPPSAVALPAPAADRGSIPEPLSWPRIKLTCLATARFRVRPHTSPRAVAHIRFPPRVRRHTRAACGHTSPRPRRACGRTPPPRATAHLFRGQLVASPLPSSSYADSTPALNLTQQPVRITSHTPAVCPARLYKKPASAAAHCRNNAGRSTGFAHGR